MINKNKNNIIFIRLIFWLIYLLSGLVLYIKSSTIYQPIIISLKIFYPLSIFWAQIRLTNKENWLPINKHMSTAQVWFRLIPILASLFTVFGTLINMIIIILNK